MVKDYFKMPPPSPHLSNKTHYKNGKFVTLLSYATYSIFVLVIVPIVVLALSFIIINNIYNKGMKFGDILNDKNDRQIIYIFYAIYLILMIPKLLITLSHDMKQT